jgi:predicted Zn-dependent protease
MERACSYFIKSLRSCPDNPLSFYLLARCFEEIGEKQKANRCFAEAQALFSRCGWVPSELRAKLRH